MKYVLRAWGQSKRGCEVLALCEMCFQGMLEVEKGVVSCWHCVKHVLRAWGRFTRGFKVLALCEICFEGMGAVEKGV